MIQAFAAAAQLMRAAPPGSVFTALRDSLASDGLTARLWLADYRQVGLRSVDDSTGASEQVSVSEGAIGRVYASQRHAVLLARQGSIAYLPLHARGERLGVLQVTAGFSLGSHEVDQLEDIADALAAELIAAMRITDHFERPRRNRALTVAAEMQWALLPPTGYRDERVSLAGLVEPAYSIAGDAFDWSVASETVTIAVFDGVARGVTAAMATALCVNALRNARRAPVSLADQVALADQALYAYFGGESHISTLVVQLDLRSGHAVAIDAGSPQLFVIRDRDVSAVVLEPQLPLGMFEETHYREQQLTFAPGDRLMIVSDGVHAAGTPVAFGVTALREAIDASLDSNPPEAVRHIIAALHAHHTGELEDDAVALCLDWRR
ncbi:MAG TPA: PP2C family protein-serine/threonine phosphatase [Acidothermaceae bacterium]|jgi:serine phosphatase RsbU (regulator of sigma subunit)|nr:PP2C family protein-serine/threonine phosphatase [Acidothermaceae bacterium]